MGCCKFRFCSFFCSFVLPCHISTHQHLTINRLWIQ
uniref:Uncharacterized protein n=1 Tax=Anguilla anguilla TaxID=7936 RepID=A0A0E9QTZ3_ANGAN